MQRPTSETVIEPVHGRRQVHPQPHRVIVGGVKRHPDHGLRTLDTPRPHERRLAVTGPRVEQRQRRSAVVIEHLEQACPAQHPSVNPRQHQLRLDHPQPLTSDPRCLGTHSIPRSRPSDSRPRGRRTTPRARRLTQLARAAPRSHPLYHGSAGVDQRSEVRPRGTLSRPTGRPGAPRTQLCGQHVTANSFRS